MFAFVIFIMVIGTLAVPIVRAWHEAVERRRHSQWRAFHPPPLPPPSVRLVRRDPPYDWMAHGED